MIIEDVVIITRAKVGGGDFKVTKFSHITEIIIPFFKENLILGAKSKDFLDWCLVAEKIKKGVHRTPEGVAEILCIKNRMNTGRKIEDE